jgi:hypothetical protein
VTRAERSRREILRAFAAAGSAGLFAPWLRPPAAWAATGGARSAGRAPVSPIRLLIYWQGSGVSRQSYQFRSMAGGPAREADFRFPDIRAPLEAVKSDVIALENVDMVSATVDPLTAADAHTNGVTHSLAATGRANRDTAGGPSFDQFVAKSLNRSGPITRFPSLALAAQCDGNVTGERVCTDGPGQVITLEPDPARAFDRLMSGLASPAQDADASARRHVIDAVLGDFDALRKRVGKAERDKLDAHAQAIRDLETRLEIRVGSGASRACAAPDKSVLEGTGNLYPATVEGDRANFSAMARLIQVAFACDLTRVVLLTAPDPVDAAWGYVPGRWGTTDRHDLIHKTSYNEAGLLKGNAEAMKAVTAMHQFEARRFVALLDLLRQVPDLDGRSLLDHTIVLWCSQIAEHGHDLDQLPWILAGGAAAGFRLGRYVRYERRDGKGVPHNNLFVTIARAMGLKTNSFGNPAVCTGVLDRLRTA